MLLQCAKRAVAAGLAESCPWPGSVVFRCMASISQQPLTVDNSNPDWKEHTNVEFSIRPSVLSPLFATHSRNVEAFSQQTSLGLQLQAQDFLQGVLDVRDTEADKLYSYRISQYDRLLKSLDQLSRQSRTPECTNREEAVAFFELLSEQARQGDEGYRKFWQLVTGHTSVWAHWDSEFAAKFADSPVLEPMEVIYNKRDTDTQDLKRLRLLALKQVSKDFQSSKPAGGNNSGAVQMCGKRKTSVANVILKPGQGSLFVNGKPFDDYFRDFFWRAHILKPLFVTDTLGLYSFKVNVTGGGVSGQAQAIRHAVSKAIHKLNPQLGPVLAKADLLERDSRVVERKKPGKKKARKSFTWVKR